jgi:translation initiation factor 2 gamma subunit (eIF-2gamma)
MRDFIRGFFFDPELEEKVHEFADRANKTARRAEKVASDAERLVHNAERKIRSLDGSGVATVLATVLVGAGVIIGGLLAKAKEEKKSD